MYFCLEDLKISSDEISEGKLRMFDRNTVQKMKFFIKDCFGKCDQIGRFLQIWSYLMKKVIQKAFFVQ